MARLRQDPTTWIWIIAGQPKARPEPPKTSGCPFCPGRDSAGEIVIGEKFDSSGNWSVRILADRAPVLHFEGEPDRQAEGLYDSMDAIGAHEIIVEGRDHSASLATLPPGVLAQTLEAVQERIIDLKRDPRLRFIEIFQNQGAEAGALIAHPHAQLVASPMVPTRVERELRAARRHYQGHERCLYCDLIRQESQAPERVVELTNDYIVICPYASRSPYEVWVLPRAHNSAYEQAVTTPAAAQTLAAVLGSTLGRCEALTPSLSLVLHTEPNRSVPTWLRADWQTLSEDYHWHLEITPRIHRRRKVLPDQEYFLNPVLPEEAAAHLRSL
jgi:UDPglucose--hexose-1-phosphate uridylyltransferase